MLENTAMLVQLSMGSWSARKNDKEANRKVSEMYGNDEKMSSAHKFLIDPDALDGIESARNKARTFHENQTLPWINKGPAILPAANLFKYREGMVRIEAELTAEIDKFIANVSTLINDARIRLNGRFNPADYPDLDTLRNKFYFKISIFPIPTADDFRLQLTDSETERIKREITEQVTTAAAQAQQEIWNRLHEVVKRFVDTLPQFDPTKKGAERHTFRDSLVDNATDLCDLLTRLNFNNDPELEAMRKAVETKLTKYPADRLRISEQARQNVTQDAKSILAAMAPFMS